MVLAWGVCAVFATFIARYAKSALGQWFLCGYTWVHVHIILQLFTMMFTYIAFGVIVKDVYYQGLTHFQNAHEILGLVVIICMSLQPVLGLIPAHMFRKGKDRKWYHIVFSIIHGYFGRIILILALFTIFLGLDLFCVNLTAFVGYCVLVGFVFILFVPFELLRWLSPWGAYFGGVGFSYSRFGKGANNKESDEDELEGEAASSDASEDGEDKGSAPKSKLQYPDLWVKFEQSRAEHHIPLVVKIVPWIFAGFCAAVIVGMWVQITVELADENSNETNPYRSGCLILTSSVG